MLDVDVPLQPKQAELYDLVENSEATWIGYGGSRGGSKSHAARAIMLLRRLSYPKTRGVIFRRTYEKVRENHIEPLFRQYPFMRPWFNQQNKEVNLPNGSAILFRYAENPGDVDDYIGKEYMDFVVDQAEMLTEKELLTLKSCTRWPGIADNKCKFIATFNPGNVGHKFLKRIFYDQDYREKERPQDFAFLQAFGWDNVEWSREALSQAGLSDKDYYRWDDKTRFEYFIQNSQYGRELDSLPESLRIGWLLGRMDRFAGQYFDCFDPAIHCYRPQETKIESWWPRWISIDWGHAHPSAVYWHAKDRDRVYTYRELVGARIDEPDLGRKIAFLSNADLDANGDPIRIRNVYISPDANAKRGSARTVLDQVGEELRHGALPFPELADDDRIGGARLCYNLLKSGHAFISTTCHHLIECLPSLTHEEGNEEDVLKVAGDDPYDSWRYGLKSMLNPSNKPLELRVQERVQEVAERQHMKVEDLDPHTIAMMSRRAERLERPRFQRGGRRGRIWHPQSTGR